MSIQYPSDLSNSVTFLQSTVPNSAREVAPDSFSNAQQAESSQKTLTQLCSMEFSAAPNLELTPTKNASNLPEDVRHSVEMMMQQNSVDYCRNFEQLASSIETPKKIS